MKKSTIIMAAFSAFALIASAPIASAQGRAAGTATQHAIHDNDNDGVCDVCANPVGSGMFNARGQRAQNGGHYGPGDGTGTAPRDGTGYGAKAGQRSGSCDGTGIGARSGQPSGARNGSGAGQRGPGTGQSGSRRGGR